MLVTKIIAVAVVAITNVAAIANIDQTVSDIHEITHKTRVVKRAIENFNGGLPSALKIANAVYNAHTSAETARKHLGSSDPFSSTDGDQVMDAYNQFYPVLIATLQAGQEKVWKHRILRIMTIKITNITLTRPLSLNDPGSHILPREWSVIYIMRKVDLRRGCRANCLATIVACWPLLSGRLTWSSKELSILFKPRVSAVIGSSSYKVPCSHRIILFSVKRCLSFTHCFSLHTVPGNNFVSNAKTFNISLRYFFPVGDPVDTLVDILIPDHHGISPNIQVIKLFGC